MFADLTGQDFGYWYVIEFSHKERGKSGKGRRTPSWVYSWLCVCTAPRADGDICGTVRPVQANNLREGKGKRPRNCGCLHPRTTHGLSNHPAWQSWHNMRQRCSNPLDVSYPLYGARGITVCDRWNNSFEDFWADTGDTWFKGATADRWPNNEDGHYEPGNFRWATDQQQANNRRDNVIIPTPEGPMTVTQAAERFGHDPNTIFARKRYGWADEDLLLPVTETHDSKGRFTTAPGRKKAA